jgi:CRP-like cAMP-binding protein
MFVAMLMQTRLNIEGEEIITQGDEARDLYIILRGQVMVYQREHKKEAVTADKRVCIFDVVKKRLKSQK